MMQTTLSIIVWVCITVMFHDLMSSAVKILNTIFVERIKVRLAEVEAMRLQAQVELIKDREHRKLQRREEWDTV
jgi:hypothetical protein